MREIKFRAWDKIKKIFIPTDVWAVCQTDFNAFGIMIENWEEYKQGEYFYNDYQELSQFTGLHDKNGKEIFEGDVYKTFGGFYQIFLKNGAFCGGKNIENCTPLGWDCKKDGFDEYNGEMCEDNFFNEIEIIGNIYENPELLK